MKALAITSIISIAAIVISVIVILAICIHTDKVSKMTMERFDIAVDSYADMFGNDATLNLLEAANRGGIGLDDLSDVMEKAVKAGKRLVCST